MDLPFTQALFYEVFAAYNTAVWPAQLALTLIAVGMMVIIFRYPNRASRIVSFGLALLWLWLAVAYHLAFFWSINPAAPLFAGISIFAAAAFAWIGGIHERLRFERGVSALRTLGLIAVVFSLVIYPAIGVWIGHHYPAAPTFGLPCPTTLFTFGILLMASPGFPRILLIGPLLWAVIGSVAAFSLGVTQDFGLAAAVLAGSYMLFHRRTAR